ncbi:MAG: alpha/beta hydrolase [Chloroflexi bacterium]|nr:alpha/beta hydrolase [Chloroflexota bacterium]
MQHSEGTFRGSGDLELFYQSWCPESAPAVSSRAVLGILHGSGDHSGRFERLVQPLVKHNFAVYGFDMRGYGRSPGRRGHINSWAEYREDTGAFLNLIRQQNPNIPVFLMGYSLGAGILLEFVLRQPADQIKSILRGIILSGTPLQPAGVATPFQIVLARVLSRAWPTFTIQMTSDIHGVSRDPGVIEALQNDPLHHNFVTARWGTEAMVAMDWVCARAGALHLPVLFIHGGSDPLNLVTGVQRYFEAVASSDKTLKIYPESRHETHNDLDYGQVVADIEHWMAARIDAV